MANIIVVGAQWGDEGKGKIVDVLSERFDVVARYQGGNNAGHTVVVGEEKVVLHLVPSGILRKGKVCVLGNGVVIDLGELIQEMDQLERLHVRFEDHFFISPRAHMVLPYHKLLDVAHEQRAAQKIGTTGRGIGPAYVDKMARVGLRVGDLGQPSRFKERLSRNLADKRAQFPRERPPSPRSAWTGSSRITSSTTTASRATWRTPPWSWTASSGRGKRVLFEGAQGTLLDVDLGTYPYVTSSSATAGGACTGTGVSPRVIDGVLGVVKAYTTRVGEGPFPTELKDETGELLRKRGQEFGATTGRPRRTGWFDAVAVRYAVRTNGLDAFALMKPGRAGRPGPDPGLHRLPLPRRGPDRVPQPGGHPGRVRAGLRVPARLDGDHRRRPPRGGPAAELPRLHRVPGEALGRPLHPHLHRPAPRPHHRPPDSRLEGVGARVEEEQPSARRGHRPSADSHQRRPGRNANGIPPRLRFIASIFHRATFNVRRPPSVAPRVTR